MPTVIEKGSSIVLENEYAKITFSKKSSLVEEITDKQTGKDIRGEDTCFFELITKEEKNIEVTGVSLKGDVITVTTVNGSFDVKTLAFDEYFTCGTPPAASTHIISKKPTAGILPAIITATRFGTRIGTL